MTATNETDPTDIMDNDLRDYNTADYVRAATRAELEASREAAKHDGGAGVIKVDGRSCYVEE